jgi:hypothetical protein
MNWKIKFNGKYFKYVLFYFKLTFITHVPYLITTNFLLFIKSKFTANPLNVLHLYVLTRLIMDCRRLFKGPGEVANDFEGIKIALVKFPRQIKI